MEMWLLSVDWLVKLTRKPTHRAMLEDMDIHPQWDREERRAFAKVARALPLSLRRDLYALLLAGPSPQYAYCRPDDARGHFDACMAKIGEMINVKEEE